jgi:hypothetical protein
MVYAAGSAPYEIEFDCRRYQVEVEIIENTDDTLNRLTQTCLATSSPACSASQKLASYAYTLGFAGNRTVVADLSGRAVSYGYDNDYHLRSETITSDPGSNNGAENYTYGRLFQLSDASHR